MTRLFQRYLWPRQLLILALALGLALLFWPVRTLRSENFVFYFPKARHIVPLTVIQNTRYLPLLRILNLVGTVSGLQEKRKSLKVWLGNTQLELHLDNKKVRVGGVEVQLSDAVRVANGQWMIPADFLYSVLPRLTHDNIEYRTGENRIFIGDVKPTSFSARLDPLPKGARLTLQFTDKVTVQTAANNGKWVLFLGDRPVEPLEPTFRFQSPYVRDLQFSDQDGVPKLIVTPGSAALNFNPTLGEDGKTLLADVLEPSPAVVQQPQAPQQPTTASAPSTSPSTPAAPAATEQVPAVPPAAPPAPPLPAVVLDAGHGGQDAGARSRDGILEKELAAQLVERVRQALVSTKKFRVVLTRAGDADPTFDQRNITANTARPIAFLTLHAGNLGDGLPRVVVYTYQPSSLSTTSVDLPQLFVPWSRVQETHLARSRQLADELQQAFGKIPALAANPPRREQVPFRTLRSVDAPAVAIEFGSLSPDVDAVNLTLSSLQQQISAAIAQALETFQGGPL